MQAKLPNRRRTASQLQADPQENTCRELVVYQAPVTTTGSSTAPDMTLILPSGEGEPLHYHPGTVQLQVKKGKNGKEDKFTIDGKPAIRQGSYLMFKNLVNKLAIAKVPEIFGGRPEHIGSRLSKQSVEDLDTLHAVFKKRSEKRKYI